MHIPWRYPCFATAWEDIREETEEWGFYTFSQKKVLQWEKKLLYNNTEELGFYTFSHKKVMQ